MIIMTNHINILYFSRFVLKNDGDGGNRRVSQIFDIIKNYKPRFLNVPPNDSLEEPPNLPQIKFSNLRSNHPDFKRIVAGDDFSWWSETYRNHVFRLRLFAHKWAELVSTSLTADLVFVDEPLLFAPLIDKLSRLNIPVIGLEQNIETLVRGQVEQEYQHELFKKEIEYFKKCALVITISDEDTVLLNNFGVNVLHVPYYPIDEQYEFFLKIRKERSINHSKKDYILLGTALNIPTFEGMLELTRVWAGSSDTENKVLHVVGYGTEKVGEHLGAVAGSNIKIHGSVDEEKLHALLKQTRAAIVYQSNGTGALTKIAELLIADIPVYSNHHAARSYHNITGVIEYQDFSDLINKLSADEKQKDISIPIPDPPQKNLILEAISKTINEKINKRTLNDYRVTIQKQASKIAEIENNFKQFLKETEDERLNRVEQFKKVVEDLRESEADRAARLEQIFELTRLLKESEADRAARLEQIKNLGASLRASEADRAVCLEQISSLTGGIKRQMKGFENSFIVRQARRLGLIKVSKIK